MSISFNCEPCPVPPRNPACRDKRPRPSGHWLAHVTSVQGEAPHDTEWRTGARKCAAVSRCSCKAEPSVPRAWHTASCGPSPKANDRSRSLAPSRPFTGAVPELQLGHPARLGEVALPAAGSCSLAQQGAFSVALKPLSIRCHYYCHLSFELP